MRAASKRFAQSLVPARIHGVDQRLPALALRLEDPAHVTANGQRQFEISDIVRSPSSYKVTSSAFDEGKGLEVKWADGTESFFPRSWLTAKFGSNRLQPPESRFLWNAHFRKLLPELSYSQLHVEGGKERLAAYLMRYGIALLRDVPCEPGTVMTVGNEIGFVRSTNYGSLFEVIDLGTKGNNLAQTNCRILAHTDNPYRDPFPGVQMLHCLNSASEGGATVFTDGFAAAEILRKQHPAAFDLLSRHQHPFEYTDPSQGVQLRAKAPVLSLDDAGNLERICFNNRSARVIDLPPDELQSYYEAWSTFDAICNAEDNVMKVQLRPGDLAIFLNSRIMHGREEYTPGHGRHIQGCYIDHDSVRSLASGANSVHDQIAHFDVHAAAADATIAALQTQSQFCYGEGVDMLQHALQAAHCARLQNEEPSAILAALAHDVGNAPQARDVWDRAGNEPPELMVSTSDSSIGYRHHANIGGVFLESMGFSAEVAGAVQLHVTAKRALVAMNPAYMDELSQASIETLAQQGGPLSADELATFLRTPGSDVALRLRRYDDQGKETDKEVPQLDSYWQMIYDHLRHNSCGASC